MLSAEDVQIARCLESVGVRAKDGRDPLGRHRFFPFDPGFFFNKNIINLDFWFWNFSKDPLTVVSSGKKLYFFLLSLNIKLFQGENCCSDRAISFHYITPTRMYLLNYLVYEIE